MDTKAKHTPGPWQFEGEDDIPQDGAIWSRSAPGRRIADVGGRKDTPPEAEALANARLISAAPELLEALLLFRRFGQSRTDGKPCYCDSQPLSREEHSRACLAARAALAKAGV